MSKNVRTRFAPSPTGDFHIGSARTAIFNWLFARHHRGKFILRIEDTDSSRSSDKWLGVIYDCLSWLGIDWDEGPQIGVSFGPYLQSKRTKIYQDYLKILQKKNLVYDDNGAVRFKSPRKPLIVKDLVCGNVNFSQSEEPDITLQRPDGKFIFHFASVVDDIQMKITHVIRGEDHLPNTAKHLELYHALGALPPQFAHMPLTLNQDGSKMSKRDTGALLGELRNMGFLSEAVFNYLCLLGWSPKDDSEILSKDQLIEFFDIPGINKSNSSFDIDKCKAFNAKYLQKMSSEEINKRMIGLLKNEKFAQIENEKIISALELCKTKIKLLVDIPHWLETFFPDKKVFKQNYLNNKEKISKSAIKKENLNLLYQRFLKIDTWQDTQIKEVIKQLAQELKIQKIKAGEIYFSTRICTTGFAYGADLAPMLELIGKERVIENFQFSLKNL